MTAESERPAEKRFISGSELLLELAQELRREEQRVWTPLGKTGIVVSRLGLGAGPLGDHSLPDDQAEDLLRAALDMGVRVLDTAPSYGASEARIGRLFSRSPSLRDLAVVFTKGGYGVPGTPDWTKEVITRGIDRALATMCTTHIDVFFLHSCPPRDDLLEPLLAAKRAGKIRAIGYSGDGEGLAWAVRTGELDVVECSINLVDQEALGTVLPEAVSRGMGVVAKRTLMNAAFEHEHPVYTPRLRAAYPTREYGWVELASRFTAYAPQVNCALVGTRHKEKLAQVLSYIKKGPLPRTLEEDVRARFVMHGEGWGGVI
jgi:aryl-alcohol dehydrogenase-like predicted oxidoreductase